MPEKERKRQNLKLSEHEEFFEPELLASLGFACPWCPLLGFSIHGTWAQTIEGRRSKFTILEASLSILVFLSHFYATVFCLEFRETY